jgi:hypothetical protein
MSLVSPLRFLRRAPPARAGVPERRAILTTLNDAKNCSGIPYDSILCESLKVPQWPKAVDAVPKTRSEPTTQKALRVVYI